MTNSSEPRIPLNSLRQVLTPEQVKAAVMTLMESGWGRVEVVVQDHYIATLHLTESQRGFKP